ncbi:NarL family two-component system response regulator LiaR [Oikeobacillus pervagus]|uniref:NarL family two-component system response regulator LiaR n=1 Tax=Oikeobacillus pervagus TaxID=1325931 RepID=A0AAJ1WK52_9BACI|nr:helix-turn-helix transcriptional regulator [Oikeobacillus pervagus]MDQ0216375.1 NarL family two-component system response regulator LiaR [Oikeobacillus pervagus]
MRDLLSEREIEVATLVAEGLKDIEISRKLFISRRRVGEIIFSIKKKLNITSRVQIGIAAYSFGLISFQIDLQQEHVMH